MNTDSIGNFTSFLCEMSENIIVQENKPLPEKVHPNTIINRTKSLFRELSFSSIDPFQKAKLYSNLGSGLKEYILWMEKNEKELRSIVDEYGIIAPKIRIREVKITERAKKLLQLHQEKLSTEIPQKHEEIQLSVPDSVDNFQKTLEDAYEHVNMTAKSTMPKKLNPSHVQKEAELLSSRITSTKMENSKKAALQTKLVKGLETYTRWMQKNKPFLEEKLLSYHEVEQKIQTSCAIIKKQVAQLLELDKKCNQKEEPDLFKKVFSPKPVEFTQFTLPAEFTQFALSAEFTQFGFTGNSQATTILKSVIHELQQDSDISRTLTDLHKQQAGNQSLVSFLQKELEKGVCYGRVMTYLAQIRAQNGGKQSLQALYNSVSERDFIKYQILHELYVFSWNRIPTAARTIFHQSSKGIISKIDDIFPVKHPNNMSSKKMASHDKTLLTTQLNKRLPKDITQGTAIICKFSSNQNTSGHVCLIYCNPKNSTYFFYDSFSQLRGGLFTANTKKALINGAVDKLAVCAQEAKLTSISFHNYHI